MHSHRWANHDCTPKCDLPISKVFLESSGPSKRVQVSTSVNLFLECICFNVHSTLFENSSRFSIGLLVLTKFVRVSTALDVSNTAKSRQTQTRTEAWPSMVKWQAASAVSGRMMGFYKAIVARDALTLQPHRCSHCHMAGSVWEQSTARRAAVCNQ